MVAVIHLTRRAFHSVALSETFCAITIPAARTDRLDYVTCKRCLKRYQWKDAYDRSIARTRKRG